MTWYKHFTQNNTSRSSRPAVFYLKSCSNNFVKILLQTCLNIKKILKHWSSVMKFTNLSRTIFYGTPLSGLLSLKFCRSQGLSSIIKENNRIILTICSTNPANIYLFKVNSRNIKKRCEIYSELAIKTPLTSFCCFYC